MVVFSSLRPAARGINAVIPALRHSLETTTLKQTGPVVMSIRGAAGRRMILRPGIYLDRKWRDSVHFFLLLGTLPVLMAITFANLFMAQGELTDLPEDHNPQTWEFHQHPITRFIAKHIVRSPEKLYETQMAALYKQDQKRKLRLLERQVKRVMLDRQDVRGWYFFQAATDARQISADNIGEQIGTPS
ncbi:NADH dehydrogenase [ubiquinone] 1 beta subcomplex subunit 5, mitochondrial-like [Ylistrum balloti]|uniref:NADH dehydrogenase [ubiquinone] 1 beta subcomplex subunit 5, mitochondrial-like n=1 Tax=Ylistrum balloti TaxID=509963 RepID=UPI002905B1C2|nr:NADH dehydrogenase [ubiquinone] 1 beta subcomplex subunit 5, mitochondrial-like [Ylistrum balloti]